MRIHLRWTWLAVGIIPVVAAAESKVTFNFDDILKANNNTAMIHVGPERQSAIITWTTKTNEDVVYAINLYVLQDDKEEIQIQSKAAPFTITSTTTVAGSTPTRTRLGPLPKRTLHPLARQESEVEYTIAQVVGSGTITIQNLQSLLEKRSKQLLYFEAVWNISGGSSFSRPFTVLADGDSLEGDTQRYKEDKPYKDDVSGLLPGTAPTATPSGSATSSPQSSSDGGLAVGAIAGIAVACGVVGLALIGILVWFLLRRQKQSKDDDARDTYRSGRTRTDELMAEKEANAGVDASPHSPYSDDGGIHGESGSLHRVETGGVVATAAVPYHKPDQSRSTQPAHDTPRNFTPYSDHHDNTVPSPGTHTASVAAAGNISPGGPDSPTSGRGTPHGALHSQYAHLVEEGMTEDEIRRLEDEERQLDAAIEQSTRKP